MSQLIYELLSAKLCGLADEGLRKEERAFSGPQGACVEIGERQLLNLCSNNYLGLSNHLALIDAAKRALDEFGFGTSSVRFICGTQTVHRRLENHLAAFLGTEDAILFSSCFDANGGVFEALLDEQDAVISDSLNHASIIDGIRLSKAQRFRYPNNDMEALEQCLRDAAASRLRLIVTDGVFSMDGVIADLPSICDLAEKYDALVMVDDSHAVGVLGATGSGTAEHQGVRSRIDLVTGTFGKALGGASGGYVAGRQTIIEWLRQRARPYLFSNALPPMIAASTLVALDIARHGTDLRRRLADNAEHFRHGLTQFGYTLAGAGHPIIPVMIGNAKVSQAMAADLLKEGVLVTSFSFPVVPVGKARIRTQMSAALSAADIDRALAAFARVGRALNLIS